MKYIQKILANEEALHLILAAFIGFLVGIVNLLFLHFVEIIQWFIFQKTGDSAFLARDAGPILRVFVPILGGILAGLILLLHTHLSGRKKLTNVLEVVALGDGRIGMRSTLVNAWSSLISIGSGASIGREGAITQITAAFASKWGQMHEWQPYRLRLMVACGAAAPPPSLIQYSNENFNKWRGGRFACAKKMPFYFGLKNYPANLKKIQGKSLGKVGLKS